MSAALWPASRPCVVCSESFFPKATVQRYCSDKCREQAKYDRLRNDPERWAAYLARLRDKYEPTGRRRGPEPPPCSVDGCEDKHLARGFCRRHYYRDRYRRGLGRRSEPELISAMVKHYDEDGAFIDEPESRRLVARTSGRLLFPECPDCGQTMRKIPSPDDLDLRDCGACRVRALLNSEEVSWLTSGEPSTERSARTKN